MHIWMLQPLLPFIRLLVQNHESTHFSVVVLIGMFGWGGTL